MNEPDAARIAFLEAWSEALSAGRESLGDLDDWWERSSAMRDLHRTRSLEWRSTSYLFEELSVYARHVNRVVETNNALGRIRDALKAAETTVVGLSRKTAVAEPISSYSQTLSELRQAFEQFETEYWDNVFTQGKLKFESKEYSPLNVDERWRSKRARNPFLKEPKLNINSYRWGKINPYSRIETAERGIRFISDHLRLPTIKKERNLDTTFQVRVGDLLRVELANPRCRRKASLRTISRLVVLGYICAGLVEDIAGKLIIIGSNPRREVRIEKTYETLGDAGLR